MIAILTTAIITGWLQCAVTTGDGAAYSFRIPDGTIRCVAPPARIFADGFDSGNTAMWK
jgi:hypothetical protein